MDHVKLLAFSSVLIPIACIIIKSLYYNLERKLNNKVLKLKHNILGKEE